MNNLERLRRRTDEADDALLEDILESAKSIILSLRYPYTEWPTQIVEDEEGNQHRVTVLEARYMDLQVRMAEDMYNRLGGSGQLSHSENGISRSWGSEWVSDQLLREIVPMCG